MSIYKDLKGEENKIFSCKIDKISLGYSRIIAVNNKFLALPKEAFDEMSIYDSLIPLSSKSNSLTLNSNHGCFTDLEFSPFFNNLLATSHDDNCVVLWKIPENKKLKGFLNNCQTYKSHSKIVSNISFNPIVSNLICSSADGEMHIFDIIKNLTYFEYKIVEKPTCLQWNENGSLVGISENNNIIILDPRLNKKVFICKLNEKNPKFTWIGENSLGTTGLNKNNNQELKLWDIRNNNILSKYIEKKRENNEFGITPFCDKESKLIYTIGRKDIKTNVYDYSTGGIIKITEFRSKEPSLCSVLVERKCLDFNKNEIDRFATFTSKKNVYYVNFLMPNKKGFDKNLYPPIEFGEPAINSELWAKGENAEPIKKEINIINENDFSNKNEKTKQGKFDPNNENELKLEKLNEQIKKQKKEISYLKSKLKENEKFSQISNNSSLKNHEDPIRNKIIQNIKKNKSNLYDLYIFQTEPLSDKLIGVEKLCENQKFIGRKFLNKKNQICYYEIFENEKLNLINQVIKNKITFLHLPKDETYDKSKIIGFRYYKSGYLHLNNFFTLIQKYDQKYYILEKQKETKFYNKYLNCFEIMNSIIDEKYKDCYSANLIYGESFPELIGYCYSILNYKIKSFEILEPFIPNIEIPESLIEKITNNIKNNITYIEPIIFDCHVSLLFFKIDDENKRINLLIDPSRYHSKNGLDKILFPLDMRKSIHIYPESSIQLYNSCALWFYGQIELLINNETYKSIFDIYSGVNNNITYYLDVINFISNKFQHTSILNINEIKDPEKLFFFYNLKILSIDKKIIFNYLLNFDYFLKLILPVFYNSYEGLNFILKCQQIIREYREFRCLLNLNINYLKYTLKNDDNIFDIQEIENNFKIFQKEFDYKYSMVFKEISIQFINSLLKHGDEDIKKQIYSIYKNKDKNTEKICYFYADELNSELQIIKSNFKSFTLYEQDSILNFINSSKDIIFKIMKN